MSCMDWNVVPSARKRDKNARSPRLMAIFPIVLVISAMPPMLRVPAGDLVRGREESPRKDETPRHRVHIDAFLIDETLVTRAAFARFVEETHYRTSAEKLGYGMVSVEGMADWKWDKV